ncbi:MAG: hypothetical protein OEW60_02225 [Thiovulaceae bacterium]|nr:hypothetical protein [Sulfurimonadaceae bacterium]
MKKILVTLFASFAILSTVNAKSDLLVDYYVGYDYVIQKFAQNDANNSTTQKGIGMGGRLFTEFSGDLYLGLGAGFYHIETNDAISGNIAYAQFFVKYLFTDNIEGFGGLGYAMRGTPDYTTATDLSATGGMGSIGLAFVTKEGWRAEIMYSYFGFTAEINALAEEITSNAFGFHFGKTMEF